MPRTIKLGKVVTYSEESPLIKLHDPLINWMSNITREIYISTTIKSEDEL